MPAGPGGAGMPACPLGVSVIGGTMEPRAQWSVGGTHRQHADPLGCTPGLAEAKATQPFGAAPGTHPRGLTWQLPAVTLPTAAQNLRHLLRPSCHLFWMPWALTRPEADRPTPESGRLETTFFMPTVVAQISRTGKQRASLKGCTSQAPLQLRDGQ